MKRRIARNAVWVGLLSASGAAAAPNTTFLQLVAQPNGVTNPPEFVYSPATGLSAGVGAAGDGSFLAPGLLATITGGLEGVTAAPPGIDGSGPTYHLLSDMTISFSGLAAVGSATSVGSSLSQDLGPGTFTVTYDAAGGTGSPLVLLTGSVTGAVLSVSTADTSASLLSGVATYTGGLLLPQLSTAGLGTLGVFSLGMTGVTGPGGTVVVGNDTRIAGFSADGIALFDAIPLTGGGPAFPEPSSVGLSLAAAAYFASHRRR